MPDITVDRKIFIFEDNQHINEDTQCYRVDMNELLRNFYIFNPEGQKLAVDNETMEIQALAYENAIAQLMNEVSIRFRRGRQEKPYRNLFSLEGEQVSSLLDVPDDAKVLIVSTEDTLQGVTFEPEKETPMITPSQPELTPTPIDNVRKNKVTFGKGHEPTFGETADRFEQLKDKLSKITPEADQMLS